MARQRGQTRWEREAGERLQHLRRARGLSQSQLARAAGVPVGTLRGWEQGRRTPLADMLPRLAGALGCGYEDILGPPLGVSLAELQAEGWADNDPNDSPPGYGVRG
jgi:transcriptional regulator with XRE-family HTH domain